jgi:hypothetical protein
MSAQSLQLITAPVTARFGLGQPRASFGSSETTQTVRYGLPHHKSVLRNSKELQGTLNILNPFTLYEAKPPARLKSEFDGACPLS